jgi:cytoskeletal protein RodZ
VGAEVQRVSRHPEVTGSSPPTDSREAAFGPWLCEQRQLRGLSRCFVSARTRIAPERIEAIERGSLALGDDALGRGTARQLAHAIGADPEEALARMGGRGVRPEPRAGPHRLRRLLLWSGSLVALVALGALLWLGALWLRSGSAGEGAGVVYRPDYVDDLLERRRR